MNNPYKRLTCTGAKAPAEMLETCAGYSDESKADKELAFAVAALDDNDLLTAQWLAAVVANKLEFMEARL